MKLVYYSQEDPRWRNVMYSITGDKKQTIGTSACGPTCAAMAVSSLSGKTALPNEAAAYAVKNGYRTANSGTGWGFFKKFVGEYGLDCVMTGSIADVKAALKAGKLVIASMGPGHMTGGGHYVLLVGISKEGWFDVYDPNHDNLKYGNDGLIDQGIKDDGKVTARETVFAREAKQYWIISNLQEEAEKVIEKVNVTVNGKKVEDGKIINGETYVPLRVVSESLGAKVGWDNKTKTATVTK